MLAALDGPLHAIVRADPDVLIPLLARHGDERILLAFTTGTAAEAHLDALDIGASPAWQVARYAAADWRAKEELMRAAAVAGATRLDLDPDLRLRSEHPLPLARAVAYVASFKRSTSCL